MAYTDIDKSDDYFNTVLYTGNGSTQSITGVGFQPDLVWVKSRNDSYNHANWDIVRGTSNALQTSTTSAEQTIEGVTSFDSDGFTLSTAASANSNTKTFVAWNWLADNTSGSSNTDGDINSTVSVNTTSGFSIVSWTGTGTNPSTVGHGLGTAPSCIILRDRDNVSDWYVGHDGIGWTDRLKLNTTASTASSVTLWNNTAPTSSLFTISSALNFNGSPTIAYCFAEKKGFSKFGSYTGNGSSDGPFVYTGFKPAFFMIKRTDTTTNWIMYDTVRQPYNTTNPGPIYANLSSAEESNVTLTAFDILSNGFKTRNTSSWAESNASGGTYIYMAFAGNPLVTSTGIPTTAR
jgi:hypothetical protein